MRPRPHLFSRARGTEPAAKRAGNDLPPPASSALVRWLRQGLEMGICPLCRVAHKADREFIWHFSEEGAGSLEEMDELRRAHGFCRPHAEMLEQIDEQMRSMLGVSTIYVELLADLSRDLDQLGPGDRGGAKRCLACVNRDHAVQQNARYLLGLLAARPGFVEHYRDSAGLCFPHFDVVWRSGGSPAVREIVLDVQRRATATIRDDLQEFIRKEGAEAKHEPKGAEQDAWRRAIELSAGWPAPTSSAGVPENAPPSSAGHAESDPPPA